MRLFIALLTVVGVVFAVALGVRVLETEQQRQLVGMTDPPASVPPAPESPTAGPSQVPVGGVVGGVSECTHLAKNVLVDSAKHPEQPRLTSFVGVVGIGDDDFRSRWEANAKLRDPLVDLRDGCRAHLKYNNYYADQNYAASCPDGIQETLADKLAPLTAEHDALLAALKTFSYTRGELAMENFQTVGVFFSLPFEVSTVPTIDDASTPTSLVCKVHFRTDATGFAANFGLGTGLITIVLDRVSDTFRYFAK